jgi:peptide deformylase
MTILKILQYPDPNLKRRGVPVTNVADPRIQKIIDDMFETHYNADNCAALAATQLDIPDAPYITVIDFSTEKNQPLCLINGEIIAREGEMHEREACMSVAGVYETVIRSSKITVRALDRHGKTIEFTADGFMAKCVQHELDHLNGMVFIDRLSKLKRERIDKKFEKWERRGG